MRAEKRAEAEDTINKIEELHEDLTVLQKELSGKLREAEERRGELENKMEAEREEKEAIRKKLNE